MSLPLKWGFFGAGKITADFIKALKLLPSSNHEAVGIASRSLSKSEEYAKTNGLRKSYGSYTELAKDPEIDVVYIGTVNSEHFEQAKLAINHGKHVLCEKPLCLNYQQGKELADLAQSKKIFLMEGFWTVFFPAYKKFREELEKGTIGEIVNMIYCTGNKFGNMDRFRLREIGGGTVMNHGVYGLLIANSIFGKPSKIVANGHLSQGGVDITSTISLLYGNKAQTATIILDSRAQMPSEVFVIGTEGTLKIHYPFWAPTAVQTPNGRFEYKLPETTPSTGNFNYLNGAGFVYEAEEVRRCIENGLLESPFLPLEESLKVLEVADEIRRQLGVIFPQDTNISTG